MRAAALSESSYSRFRRCDMGADFRFIHNGLRQLVNQEHTQP